MLLNGQSASYIGQEKFDEAEAALQEAVERDPNNVDTLINLIVLSQQTGKPTEVIVISTLKFCQDEWKKSTIQLFESKSQYKM